MIGRVLNQADKGPLSGRRKNERVEDYIQELQDEYKYSEEEARKLDKSAMAWMAIPLYDGEETKENLVAVIYLDAVLPEFVTPERRERAALFAAGEPKV
jgi:hypothetical protein